MDRFGLVATSLSTLLLAGCGMHHARVRSVNLSEAGTYVVSTPGALTIARQSGSAWRACTLRTGVPGMDKGHHHHHHDGRGGAPGARGGGPGATLDVLLFRMCEARANNDITAQQYASGVQTILKTMSEMAERRPPGPGWNPKGPGAQRFREWMKRDRRDRGDRGDRGDKREGPRGPEAHPGPNGPPPPAHKGKGTERRKPR